jgi:hypothetical protein
MTHRTGIAIACIIASLAGAGGARAQEPPSPVQPPPVRRALPAPEKAESKMDVRIYHLKYVRIADPATQQVFSALSSVGKFAFDVRTNSLIVQTTEDRQPMIEQIVKEIDVASGAEEQKPPRQIRLVWLIGGVGTVGKEPPKDLGKVISELGKFGVADLRLAAQCLIQTTPEGTFELTSNPSLGDQMVSISFQGTLQASAGKADQVQVRLSVGGSPSPRPGFPSGPPAPQPVPQPGAAKPLQVQTTLTTVISAPLGRPVVLCMSPVESATSVFVIQVIGDER